MPVTVHARWAAGTGSAIEGDAQRVGVNVFSACSAFGRIVMPTHVSPVRSNCFCMSAQPMLMSIRFDGLNISTTTLPDDFAGSAGRRTRIRVVYGALAVRMVAGPGAGQS